MPSGDGNKTQDQKSQLIERAKHIVNRYEVRDTLLDRAETYYDNVGVSKEPATEIYYVRVPDGRNAADLMADVLSRQRVSVTVPANSENQRDKKRADEVERWLTAFLENTQIDEDLRLVHELVYDAIKRGVVVLRAFMLRERLTKNGDSLYGYKKFPIVFEVRDWRNIYPVYQRQRISEVFECYEASALDLRQDYPELGLDDWGDMEMLKVYEWWDCTHKAFWIEGPGKRGRVGKEHVWLMPPTPHEYGCLPYSVRVVRPQSKNRARPEKMAPSILGTWSTVLHAMNILESAKFTAALGYINSAWVARTNKPDFELDLTTGAVNYLLPEEDVAPLVRGQVPIDLMQASNEWNSRFQRASVPGALYGESLGSNLAGYAISLLTESGRRILNPIIQAIELCIGDTLSTTLSICENLLGPLVEDVVLQVSTQVEEMDRRQRMVRQGVKLDYETLNGMYHNVVKLGDPLPADRERSLNMAMGVRQPNASGMPLLSDETIRTDILGVTDNHQEMRRIFTQNFAGQLQQVMLQESLAEAGMGESPTGGSEQMMQGMQQMMIEGMQPIVEEVGNLGQRLQEIEMSFQSMIGGAQPPIQSILVPQVGPEPTSDQGMGNL